MSKKIITVFGATGNQGGSVISALLASSVLSSQYTIRGVTRDPTKPAAQKLVAKGVQPIKADVNDPASLQAAVHGVDAVFAVTNYWETLSKTTEITQGKNIVDACVAGGVKHLVWSSLPATTELTQGVLSHIDHFDSKAEVSAYAEARKKETGLWVTHVMPAYFLQNIKGSVRPDPTTGVPTWSQPLSATETQVATIDIVSDAGKYVAGALALGAAADGQFIQAVSQWVTPAEVVQTISDVTGTKTVFKEVPNDAWKESVPGPAFVQDEMAENMQLIRDYSYYGNDAKGKQADHDKYIEAVAGQKLTSLAEFVKANW
ncbi:NmrA family transcriptional regulator [Sporothrix schenckii 1099-18]|uniref:NmrA-like domain-containing protein n=2 Tax=Sporothrix schenckii TaxID=29908 RepID=U7PQG2_SPOS1|nr:NmrA family transcriptional regulator [Sporothrix schenckii 1099-18]ERS96730.1 hypothetical protein HMPREF1624_06939 [Sporothrix schenckii ATCC 58251]KJR81450.1 NmrA family transcriptional regulator [Sporothrix schenckii 1099-18]